MNLFPPITIVFCLLHLGHSLIYSNQPIIKLSNGHGCLLSRSRPLQTTTGLLSNIPRVEYGIRALFRSREASFYDFNLQPSISMDWKVPMPESSHKLNNFEVISSSFTNNLNRLFQSLSESLKCLDDYCHTFTTMVKFYFNTFSQKICEKASVFSSFCKSSGLKFAKHVLPSGITIFLILISSLFRKKETVIIENTEHQNVYDSCSHESLSSTVVV